ncbi:amino acid adenylation domain-containing protein [Tumebacillus sp. BK434]|uniref:non-ribosomal peptide synthase/polyketide synthase n=1 Tax=Tumebacillus sp. BK434 TaxID=2512169 RepID=UPI0010520ECB|nr:non-ribosomal peptide synthetase [Tumebacillus sp. BK434]TCP57968.1 amino acid adenylation domain-containing protein [Tumebacillus sp. BK434]
MTTQDQDITLLSEAEDEIYAIPASFSQQRLWFLEQLNPGSTYNLPAALRLEGPLHIPALEASLQEIVMRHETLRTAFQEHDGELMQIIRPDSDFSLPVTDLDALPSDDQEAQVAALVLDASKRPFDLAKGGLLRASLVRQSDDLHVLILTMHHIVSDGWSMGVLIRECVTLYQAFLDGEESPLDELPLQYADYALWQQENWEEQVLNQQLPYWKEQLQGELPVLQLPADRPRPSVQKTSGKMHHFTLPAMTAQKLNELSQQEGATLFMTLLSAFKTLLYRYTGQSDLLVGTPIAGRNQAEIEDLIGFFVNTLVVRTDAGGNPTFRELLGRVKDSTLGAYSNQDVPFEKLVEELQPARDMSYSPLFQVMFVLQNADLPAFSLPGLTFRPLKIDTGTAKFDLTLIMVEEADGLSATLEYNTDLFDTATVERMAGHFKQLVTSIAAHPDLPLSAFKVLSDLETRTQLIDWNNTRTPFDERPVHVLFEQQAERTPDATAVVFGDTALSYAELNTRANRLAHKLRRFGVGPETRVGISVRRSPDMAVGLLGILKAGGAYVPLDPNYPQERLAFMLEDSGVPVLLTQEALQDKFSLRPEVLFCLDAQADELAAESGANPELCTEPQHLAYIIYTSGSTGQPKGVQLEHRGLTNLTHAQIKAFQIDSATRLLQFASFSFDASVSEIFTALVAGATLYMAPQEELMPGPGLISLMQQHEISVVTLPPSVLALLPAAEFPALKTIVSAGEACSAELVKLWAQGRLFINAYGPTEGTVCATLTQLTAGLLQPHIGRPIDNVELYILDEQLQPVPLGASGEIHIGGIGVARGYLNRPELTAEKFIPHPFRPGSGARLYKSGDVGRFLPDGSVEYLGRLDHQVKIRGIRIEIGELEEALRALPGVQEAVVLPREDVIGGKVLVAYLTAQSGQTLAAADLREQLEAKVPAHLVPSFFVLLDAMPLTSNGKIDRKALPAPDPRAAAKEYVAPRDETEAKVAAIWADLLNAEQVGIYDNFFELGGHSLLAAQLTARVRDAFTLDLPMAVLFEAPTVAKLAKKIAELQGAGTVALPPLLPAKDVQNVPLSYAQQRLWFLAQLEPNSGAYNIAGSLRLTGSLDLAALEQSFAALLARHETLRTNFIAVDGVPQQVIREQSAFALQQIDLRARPDAEQAAAPLVRAEIARPFDLEQDSLLRVQLLKLTATEHLLQITLHHIIADGWSLGVFIGEFSKLYAAFVTGAASPLAEPVLQYKDFCVWQRDWLQGEVLQTELSYWKQAMAGPLPVLDLPSDKAFGAAPGLESGTVSAQLPAELTDRLKRLSQQEAATLFMTLNAAFNLLLSRLSGQEDIIVGTPIAGRSHSETEGMIGFFLNTLALRTDLSGNPSFRELLARVREATVGAFAHQHLPFEKLVEEVQPDRTAGRNPLFDVMINLNNTPQQTLALPGLTLEPQEGMEAPSKFMMTLYLDELADDLHLRLSYRQDLFSPARMHVFLEQLTGLLEQIAAAPEAKVSDYSLVTAATRSLLPDAKMELDAPAHLSIQAMLAERAAEAPAHTAVSQGERRWSYGELIARRDELTRALLAAGVQKGDTVALYGQRSFGLIAALFAVLQSGGVLLNVDQNQPLQRQQTLLQEANARLLLHISERSVEELDASLTAYPLLAVDPHSGHVLTGLAANDAPSTSHAEELPFPEIDPDDPAYLFYTSGSTGVPKGVLGTHRGLNHFMSWQRETFALTRDDRAAQLIHLSFDPFLRDVFLPLVSGATLCLPRVLDDLGADTVLSWLAEEGITVLQTVPSVAQSWLTYKTQDVALPSLRYAFFCGEKLNDVLVARWRQAFPSGQVVNLYGPTETTMAKLFHLVPDRLLAGTQPVGFPLPNTQALVQTASGALAGVGEPGEIVIRTPFCTKGYLNAPEETHKRFLPNPARAVAADLVYLTGDRGRYRPDGALEVLGRLDNEVKIHGVRIQTTEIEAALLHHPQVEHAAVVDWQDADGQTYLAAYAVTRAEVTATELRKFLEQRLLAAMVPSAYVFLAELPLTASGKVNRKALPQPELGTAASETAYVAPRTATEEQLAAIWADLLNADQVGADDDFFSRGGHSLLATQMISRVRAQLGVELPLATIFEASTVRLFAARIEAAKHSGQTASVPAIVPADRQGHLPLSFSQQRLWFLDQLEASTDAYHIPLAVRLSGALNTAALEQSLHEIVQRHEALRTNFLTAEGTPQQVIRESALLPLLVFDLSGLAEDVQAAETERLIEAETRRPFSLADDLLIRAGLLKLADDDHVLVLTLHHIVSDVWSMGVLIGELTAVYAAVADGKPSPLAPLPVQYADYAVWQRNWLQGDVLADQIAFWQGEFAGELPVLELPTDRPRPPVQTFQGATHRFELPRELHQRLLSFSQAEGATLFMTLFAAFNTLLARYSNQEDVILGTPIANRQRGEVESLIGFFVNTLALRTDLSGNPTFPELVARVRRTALGAYANQDLPFEKLVESLQLERDLSRHPLFQVVFMLQNAPLTEAVSQGLTFRPLPLQRGAAKFDLSLTVTEHGDGMAAALEYNTDLFDEATVARLAVHYHNLLENILAHPAMPIGELSFMSESELHQVLTAWNDTGIGHPQQTLPELLAAQTARTPDAIALIDGERRLTFAELNARANQVAHYLQKRGIGTESLVGLCMERSAELVISLLGILKAGGAYVPLDPNYPTDRSLYTLEDAKASLLLTQSRFAETLQGHGGATVCYETAQAEIAAESTANPVTATEPHHLAYVIYTSGSTGRPKGVAVEHRSVSTLVHWAKELLAPEEYAGMLFSTSVCFDLSVFELWVPLAFGGKLILADSALHLPQLPARSEVTLINTVPSSIAELARTAAIPPNVTTVVLCGEPLKRAVVQRLHDVPTLQNIYNIYGPTEDTVYSTFAKMEPGQTGAPVIGRPIDDTQAYVLNQHLQPVPSGVAGELLLGGAGLARGYLHQPELTAERFIENPFVPGTRLYRTGDLVRWLPDGTLDYISRLDHQVKVRGFRIELGEIEMVLTEHPSVKETTVIVREDQPGDQRVVAYVVPAPATGEALSAADLRQIVRRKLPEYMVPSHFVVLEALPLTPNGKIDKKALPLPEIGRAEQEAAYVAPRTATEQLLAAIWSELLGAEQVGVHDNFFALGGHSLLATQMISRVRQSFQIELPLSALFEVSVLGDFAARIDAARQLSAGTALAAIAPAPRGDRLPLSFAQQRLWFLDQLDAGSSAYHIPLVVRLSGPLDTALLQDVFQAVAARHESLRTNFITTGGVAEQVIQEEVDLPLTVTDLSALDPDAQEQETERLIAEETGRPFKLATDLLVRTALLKLAPDQHMLIVTMHHIVTDAWSMGVFIQEIFALYDAFRHGQPAPLPKLAIQYADYAVWQREHLQGAVLDAQIEFWKNQFSGELPTLELPTDRQRPPVQSFRGAVHRFELSQELRDRLHAFNQQHGATVFMTMFAAFNALLHRYSGQTDLILGTPIANRHRAEVEGLIGFFVNTLALRTDLSGAPSFAELVARVRDTALGAYAHQDLPFEHLIDELHVERDLSRHPLFQVMFTLQNAPQQRAASSDLTFEHVELQRGTAKFDLELTLIEQETGLQALFEYSTDLYNAATIERMAVHFQVLLASLLADPAQSIAKAEILPPDERELVLFGWNDTAVDFPQDALLHELFEAQAARTPERVAAIYGDDTMTYAELEARANQLAHYLLQHGVGPDTPVGVCIERSHELVIALIGILKAGGAFMPIDTEAPTARIAQLAEEASAPVVLTQAHLRDKMPEDVSTFLCIDAQWPEIAACPATKPELDLQPEHLVSIYYTSGSTGKPKGVASTHRGWVNRMCWMQRYHQLQPDETVLQKTTLTFDDSAVEFYWPLMVGARIALMEPGLHRDPRAILDAAIKYQAAAIQFVPPMLSLVVETITPEDRAQLQCLRNVVSSGEGLRPELVRLFQERIGCRLHNTWGATEVSIDSTVQTCTAADATDEGFVSVGRPIDNNGVYVLDSSLQPVPIGVYGDLYLTGVGLARNYHNNPERTAEAFLPDPFVPGERMYKTGDRGYFRPDGTIKFVGRQDNQIKIRGMRVELGEIETVVGQYPDVRESIVIAHEVTPGDKRLAAYLVGPQGVEIDIADVRNFMQAKLPEHMVPSFFLVLDKMPLTPNGKVDRRALPAPSSDHFARADDYVAPRDELEARMAAVWEEVLGVSPIGIRDNFFSLGGHSLLAVRLMSQLQNQFKDDLPLAALFQGGTIEHLAELVRQDQASDHVSPLIGFKTTGSRTPFFVVHEGTGGVLDYVDLAQTMDAEQPFYAFQAQGLQDDRDAHAQIEEAAAAYIAEMRTVQPAGPYYIGGYCFGGVIAFEMAQQLIASGEKVELLSLFDTYVPKIAEHGDYTDEKTFAIWFVRKTARGKGFTLPPEIDELIHLDTEEVHRRIFEAAQAMDLLPPDVELLQFKRLLKVYRAIKDAHDRYTPATYPGTVTLFLAEEQPTDITDQTLGWGACSANINVIPVPGDHETIMKQPNVKLLTNHLKQHLPR